MKPTGTPPFAWRLLFALGFAFACVASHATAQNVDVDAALYLVNKAAGLPITGSHPKPALTLGTVSSTQLSSLVSDIVDTTGTFQVSGTGVVESSTPVTGGTTVIFPAPGNAGADAASILATINTFSSSTVKLAAAAADVVTDYYADFPTVPNPPGPVVASTSADYSAVVAAAASNSLFLGGAQALTQAKADSAELAVLEAAVSANSTDYNNIVVATFGVSDPAPTAQALMLYKTLTVKAAPSLFSLANAISVSGVLIDNGGPFMQNYFQQDKLSADQLTFVEGYTQGYAPGLLEVTATSIVSGAIPNGLSFASRTNIAQGLYISGTTTSGGANANTILADVTTGIVSGYITGLGGISAQVADKDQATLVGDIITQLGVSSAEVVAQAGALDLNAVSADVAAYAQVVAKIAAVKADISGVDESDVAQGVGNDYALTSSADSNDIQLKSYVTQGVVAAYKAFAPQIVDAVAAQILAESYNSAQFANALGIFMEDIATANSSTVTDTLSPNNALIGTMLAALAQDASTQGNAASTNSVISQLAVSAILGSQTANNNISAKDSAAVVLQLLTEFATSGSASTVQEVAGEVAQTGTGASQPTSDAITAAMISSVKTSGTLVQYISEGASTNLTVVSQAAYGGTDGFVKAVATDVEGSTLDIANMATGLAGTPGFTPEQVANDLTDGAEKDYATIADTLAGDYPGQSANIAAAVSASAGISGLSSPDAIRYKIATDVIGTTGSNYEVAVSGSVAATISVNADKTTLAVDVLKSATTNTALAPAIADAVALTVPTGDGTLAEDLDSIAAGVGKQVPGSILNTATSVEQIALNEAASPVETGTAFGNGFMGLSLPVVVQIAHVAALDQTVAVAGNVGTGVAQLSKIESSLTETGSVAVTVAAAATEFLIPGDSINPAVDDSNYSYYTVAGAFGSVAATNSKIAADLGGAGGIASALAADLQESGTAGEVATGLATGRGAQNQAAAAVAYNLAIGIIDLGYSSNTSKYVIALAQAVATAQPQAVADIYGYIAEALDQEPSWTAADVNTTLFGSATGTFATAKTGSLAAILEGISSGAYTADIAAANGDLGAFAGGDGTYVTADETPIVNF